MRPVVIKEKTKLRMPDETDHVNRAYHRVCNSGMMAAWKSG